MLLGVRLEGNHVRILVEWFTTMLGDHSGIYSAMWRK